MNKTHLALMLPLSLLACGTPVLAPPRAPAASPLVATPAELEDLATTGEHVFADACGKCHTTAPDDRAPSIAGESWTEARLHQQIRAGGGGKRNVYLMMAPIDEAALPEARLPALYAFLRTRSTLR